jgi:hypothetical protein
LIVPSIPEISIEPAGSNDTTGANEPTNALEFRRKALRGSKSLHVRLLQPAFDRGADL